MRLMNEFAIRTNVKSEFCAFTTNIIQHSMETLDERYQVLRSKILQRYEMKVLEIADQIDAFANEFNQLKQVVDQHAETGTRSLFQVFVDNLICPERILSHKANLHDMRSPLQIRQKFAEMIQKVEKNSQNIFNGFVDEFVTIIDGKPPEKKVQRGRKRIDKALSKENESKATSDAPKATEACPEYFTYGDEPPA